MCEGTPRHCAGRHILLDCFARYAQYDSLPDLRKALMLQAFLVDLSCEALYHRPQQKNDEPNEIKERYIECKKESWSNDWFWQNTKTYPGK